MMKYEDDDTRDKKHFSQNGFPNALKCLSSEKNQHIDEKWYNNVKKIIQKHTIQETVHTEK